MWIASVNHHYIKHHKVVHLKLVNTTDLSTQILIGHEAAVMVAVNFLSYYFFYNVEIL